MQKTNIKRLIYHVRHHYLTTNTAVIAVAFFIAASWAWGAVGVMQKNYSLQKEVDTKRRELQLAQIETRSQELEKKYYQSEEYQELAVRKNLGLAAPGERVLILPTQSTPSTLAANSTAVSTATIEDVQPSNFQQWINFIFGGNHRHLQE